MKETNRDFKKRREIKKEEKNEKRQGMERKGEK